MRVFDAEATIYSWNETMRVVCPCPAVAASSGDSMNVSITLDGKSTISDVLGQPVQILAPPVVTHTTPSIWTLGTDLELQITGTDFPAQVTFACGFYAPRAEGYIFESFHWIQQSVWQGLIEDSCDPVPVADYTHQWQDVRESHCALAGLNVSYDGNLLVVPAERLSARELLCHVPAAVTER
ncbi:unnamed protein product, partial [Effrenium voratum]